MTDIKDDDRELCKEKLHKLWDEEQKAPVTRGDLSKAIDEIRSDLWRIERSLSDIESGTWTRKWTRFKNRIHVRKHRIKQSLIEKKEQFLRKIAKLFYRFKIKSAKFEAPRLTATMRIVFSIEPNRVGRWLRYEPYLRGFYGYPGNWTRMMGLKSQGDIDFKFCQFLSIGKTDVSSITSYSNNTITTDTNTFVPYLWKIHRPSQERLEFTIFKSATPSTYRPF